METSLKTDFAQIFSRCPKNLSCPKIWGGCSPPRPPGPYPYGGSPWILQAPNLRFSDAVVKLRYVSVISSHGWLHTQIRT